MRYYTGVVTQTGLLTLLSAVLFPLALQNELFPLGNALVGIVALAPFYLALLRTDAVRNATRLGVLFGAVSTILANYWLMFFEDYSIWTIGGTTIGYVAYNYLLAGFLWRALRAPRAYRPVLFAMVWTVYEFLKSVGFLAYPWGLAAYPFNEIIVMIQLADLTGVWGLTFLAVYLNSVVAEALHSVGAGHRSLVRRERDRNRSAPAVLASRPTLANAAMLAVLLIATAVYGWYRLGREIPVLDTMDLVLIQQNADSWNARDVAGPLQTTQNETRRALAEASFQPELVVWNETTLRYFYVEGRDWYTRNPPGDPFVEFVTQLPAPLMTGAPFQDPDDELGVYNSVLLIDQDSSVRQWYAKQHLVPFAEAIPFWELDAVRRFFANVIGLGGTWAHGPGTRLFTAEGNAGEPVTIATPICFEDAFAYVNRRFVAAGADLILNLTNNSWSRTNSAQLQHFVAARYRAVETRRGLVRSTNSGYTSIVDPWGRVVASTPMFETNHLNATVNVYRPQAESVYVVYGDYLPVAFALILAGLFAVALAQEKAALRRPSGTE